MTDQVVILGAGRAVRGSLPSAMVDIHQHGRVMDWLIDAFGALDAPSVAFVGGYRAEEVLARYPDLLPVLNREWARTGPVHSLGLVPADVERRVFVTYADVVFRRPTVEALDRAPGDVVLAVDTHWRARYDARSPRDLDRAEKVLLDGDGGVLDVGPHVATDHADAEFAGVLVLHAPAARAAFAAIAAGSFDRRATLPELVTHLRDAGLTLRAVDLEGDWAELDAQQDLARFVLGTKAESLERLQGMQHGGEIGELAVMTAAQWQRDRDAVLTRVLEQVPGERLIVRSSARSEDTWTESAAGRFESVLDVARTTDALGAAIDEVFASYGVPAPDDQVLVQEMLRAVAMSGVIMTRTHALGAPYYVINFDDRTARTDTVTGGGDVRTAVCLRSAPLRSELPAALAPVLSTVQDIEKLVGHDSLDVEFAVTVDERVHVLQVRPIAIADAHTPVDDDAVVAAVGQARRFVEEHAVPSPTVVGSSTRYSVMTDWNPAEIIGTKPRRLATSLYRYLVTDDIWAQQRAEYGYRDLRPCPLLVEIAGQPFVDVRASFASFVPAAVPDDLARRLVDHALDRLAAEPNLHDKVEFAVLTTCLAPDFDADARALTDAGFTAGEIGLLRAALGEITRRGVDRLAADVTALEPFSNRLDAVLATPLPPLDRVYHLLALGRVGTLTFAHLARGAFVATSLLRGLAAAGAVEPARVDAYLRSIATVFGELQADARRVAAGGLEWDEFVATYGHLRPGTYDITAPSYRSAPDEFLAPLVSAAADTHDATVASTHHRWTATERGAIERALAGIGLPMDVDAFDGFAAGAIAGREQGKFVFTRALSAALDDLVEFGARNGLTVEDLSHLRLADLLVCRDAVSDPGDFLARRAVEGREAHDVSQAVSLPGQIASLGDLVCFEQAAADPNFVTVRSVQAATVDIAADPHAEVGGRIVLIPQADPGYDWLLARGIAGLITMFGGANSHMAVRAAESGLPAAIGVGELRYAALAAADRVRLDCGSRTITVVA